MALLFLKNNKGLYRGAVQKTSFIADMTAKKINFFLFGILLKFSFQVTNICIEKNYSFAHMSVKAWGRGGGG